MRFTLRQLQVFVCAAQQQSVSRAAETLALSQSAASSSLSELERRLVSRGQDAPEIIKGRMDKSRDEISHWAEYDYVLVNDDLDATFAHLTAILSAERLRRERQKSLGGFVKTLMEGERA